MSSEKEEGIFKSKEGQSQCSLELTEGVQSEWCEWVGSVARPAGGVAMSSHLQTDLSLPGES